EINARSESGTLFEYFSQIGIGRSGISCGLEHDQRTLLEVGGDRTPRIQDIREIRLPISVQRGRNADDRRAHLFDAGEVGGGIELPLFPLLRNQRGWDVL